MTEVVNLRYSEYDVYIGRAGHSFDGYFGNEHPIGYCKICDCVHNRETAISSYKVYFNDLETLLGLQVYRYNSGNISGAKQNGQKISNSQAKSILNRLAGTKVFFDLTRDTFVVQYGHLSDREMNVLVANIEARIAAA